MSRTLTREESIAKIATMKERVRAVLLCFDEVQYANGDAARAADAIGAGSDVPSYLDDHRHKRHTECEFEFLQHAGLGALFACVKCGKRVEKDREWPSYEHPTCYACLPPPPPIPIAPVRRLVGDIWEIRNDAGWVYHASSDEFNAREHLPRLRAKHSDRELRLVHRRTYRVSRRRGMGDAE